MTSKQHRWAVKGHMHGGCDVTVRTLLFGTDANQPTPGDGSIGQWRPSWQTMCPFFFSNGDEIEIPRDNGWKSSDSDRRKPPASKSRSRHADSVAVLRSEFGSEIAGPVMT